MSSKERNSKPIKIIKMKPELKFDHDAITMADALGMKETAEQMSDEITEVVKGWMIDDKESRQSKLAEALHKNLPYEVILFLATKEVSQKLKETLSETDAVRQLIKSMGELIEQIEVEKKAKLN